jgi:EAL domain-containing protein (putative c-di-GMP-specific phosphodiesterase class I)
VKSGVAIMSGEDERIIETVGLLAQAHGLRLLGTVKKPVTAAALEELFQKLRDPATTGGAGKVVAPAQDIENAFKRGELLLQYQPKVWLDSGELGGAEALIRWNHPEYGMFQPGAFVPLIEESAEHTRSLAEYTMREAIAAAGRSARRGAELRVALNLSRRAFNRLDLPEWAESLCKENGVPPAHVTLEVTETAVKHDWVNLLDVASRLRLKGFALSVDDFGTGESGLSQLKRLPFSELKIDREFVDGCSRSATQRSVVEASLALARSLGMTSVAEGAQYKADWDVLIDLGCDMVQGYYVSPPLSEETLFVWRERETPIRH